MLNTTKLKKLRDDLTQEYDRQLLQDTDPDKMLLFVRGQLSAASIVLDRWHETKTWDRQALTAWEESIDRDIASGNHQAGYIRLLHGRKHGVSMVRLYCFQ